MKEKLAEEYSRVRRERALTRQRDEELRWNESYRRFRDIPIDGFDFKRDGVFFTDMHALAEAGVLSVMLYPVLYAALKKVATQGERIANQFEFHIATIDAEIRGQEGEALLEAYRMVGRLFERDHPGLVDEEVLARTRK